LDEGLHRKLTLIAAPAGFGKTTLVSEWVAGCGRPTAWLSLDDGDNDSPRFLAYLIAAVQTVAPQIGTGVIEALQSPQPPPTEAILTALLNEFAALPEPCILVLDDYHVIDAEPVDRALTFLLEHLPPQLHLVIATREDPPLPLARWRARGYLAELRAADLRFTARWTSAPRAGSPACSWPRSPCRAAATRPSSSGHSPATTGTSSTTWSTRSCGASPSLSAASCSRRRSSTG
jgi:LuxR family maltose regulon positive regulatory protein